MVLLAVGNEHRHAVLDSLNNAPEETLDYDVLVDRVADKIRDENSPQAVYNHHQRTRLALRHTHIPKLEDAQIINHEEELGRVQFVGGDLVVDLLELVESYEAGE